MPSVQVPLWATYSLAIVALVSPLGGALIGGMVQVKRDDKRWARERDQEDLRFERETLKLREERHHDLIELWHTQRLDGHTRMIHSIARWREAADFIRSFVSVGVQPTQEMVDQAR